MKKINEEVVVSLAGANQLVRVIEVEEDWTPFRPVAAPSNYDSDEDEEERSACSDNIILEDSEFVPETQNGGNGAASEKECRLLHGEYGNGTNIETNCSAPSSNIPGMSANDYPGHAHHFNSNPGHMQSPSTMNRPTSSFPPPGPMPSFNSGMPIGGVAGPLNSLNSNLPIGGINSTQTRRIARLRNHAKNKDAVTNQRPNTQPVFDLNKSVSPSRSKLQSSDGFSVSNQVSPKSPSHSMDVEQTIEIGKQLGFQIEHGNKVHLEALCGEGVKKVVP